MNIKTYLFTIFVGFVIALGIWLLILFNTDPFKADFLTLGAFFASLFITLTCSFSLLGYYLRVQIGNKEVVYAHLPVAFRQGVLLSLVVIVLLILQSMKLLNWWIAGIVVVVILLMELFFHTKTVS